MEAAGDQGRSGSGLTQDQHRQATVPEAGELRSDRRDRDPLAPRESRGRSMPRPRGAGQRGQARHDHAVVVVDGPQQDPVPHPGGMGVDGGHHRPRPHARVERADLIPPPAGLLPPVKDLETPAADHLPLWPHPLSQRLVGGPDPVVRVDDQGRAGEGLEQRIQGFRIQR